MILEYRRFPRYAAAGADDAAYDRPPTPPKTRMSELSAESVGAEVPKAKSKKAVDKVVVYIRLPRG